MSTKQKTEKYLLVLEKYEGAQGGISVLGQKYMPYWHKTPFPVEDREEAHKVLCVGIEKLVETQGMDLRMPPKVVVSMQQGEKPVAEIFWV